MRREPSESIVCLHFILHGHARESGHKHMRGKVVWLSTWRLFVLATHRGIVKSKRKVRVWILC